MPFRRSHHSLEHDVRLCHRAGARIRLHVPWVRYEPGKARALEAFLAGDPRLRSVSARETTGSLILVFRTKTAVDPHELSALLASLPAGLPFPGSGVSLKWRSPTSRFPRVVHLLALSAFALYYLARLFLLKAPLSPAIGLIGAALGGLPLFRRALHDLEKGTLFGAHSFLSGASLLAMATGEVPAALEVIWIQEVGEFLEDTAQDRSRRAIREAILAMPRNAFVLADGVEVEVSPHAVRTGDLLAVHASERLPADGTVLSGEALVDESHITGRPEPALKSPGDPVFAGTVLEEGFLRIRAEKVGEQTYLARITRMVEAALLQKAGVEKEADRLAARLTILGLGVSAAVFLWTRDLVRTLSVQLALASPCATVLAASTAVTAALAGAARRQVFIKGGAYLEQMARIDCICFDKTGTLTEDKPRIVGIVPATRRIPPDSLLTMAAEAQGASTHPIARALIRAAPAGRGRGEGTASVETVPGRGVRAHIGEDVYVVGNAAFVSEEGIRGVSSVRAPDRLMKAGCTLVYVAENGKLQGVIGLDYGPRRVAADVLRNLRMEGISEIHLLSGDENEVVRRASVSLPLTRARGNMLPEQKASYVGRLSGRGRIVAMVGDGINDAPALARADVGIAMGAGGAEAAMEAADIALADSRLEHILFLRRLSRRTLRIISQNHVFAVITDLISAALAASGMFPPLLSGAAHVVHTGVILANSSRLLSDPPSSRTPVPPDPGPLRP